MDCWHRNLNYSGFYIITKFSADWLTTVEMAITILHWYSYRWQVEEYHKLLKSGVSGRALPTLLYEGMKPLLGFLRYGAAELLQHIYIGHNSSASKPIDPQSHSNLHGSQSKISSTIPDGCLGCRCH
jgi:hypothetical protein